MVDDDEPNMVNSGKSQRVIVYGLPFSTRSTALRPTRPGPWKWSIMRALAMSGMIFSSLTRTHGILRSRQSSQKARLPSCAVTM